MKKIAIINHYTLKRVDYSKIFSTDDLIYIYTKKELVEYYNNMGFVSKGYDDTMNLNPIYMDIIKDNDKIGFNYIVSSHEIDIYETALLREKLNICGLSSKTANNFKDKIEMKKNLIGHVKLPKFQEINSIFDLFDWVKEQPYPFIIKPRASAGSFGVTKINNEVELKEYLDNNPKLDNLMVEEFIHGDMIHVDGVYSKRDLKIVLTSKYINDCLNFKENKFLGSYTLSEDNPIHVKVNGTIKKVLEALTLKNEKLIFHAEFFVTKDNQIIFCEIGARMGGGRILESTRYVKKIDLLVEDIKLQSDYDKPLNDYRRKKNEICSWILIYPEDKVLKSIKLASFDWVIHTDFKDSNIKKRFTKASNSVESVVSYVIIASTKEELKYRIEELYKWHKENTEWCD